MKRLGPELKMPDLKGVKEMKAPTWLADLYYDMRDRRLLPLVALVAVAIAAVPFLLGGSEEEVAPPVAGGPAAGEAAVGAEPTRLTVVEAKPGLRNYKKRLKRRSPSNPFAQKYTSVPQAAQLESVTPAGGGETSVSASDASGDGGGVTSPPSGDGSPSGDSGSSPGGSGGEGGGGGDAPSLIEFVVDVQVSRSQPGTEDDDALGKPKTHRRVRTFEPLPGKKAPVVTTMGINLRTLKVLFLVSDQAHSLDGEFRCLARTPKGICELVEVEPGLLFDVVYGPNKVRYSFKVTEIDAIRAGTVGGDRYERAGLSEGLKGILSGR